MKPLTAAMDNVLASKLGAIARKAGDPKRKDVGDSIDRGLILRRLLEEGGFEIREKCTHSHVMNDGSCCHCGEPNALFKR